MVHCGAGDLFWPAGQRVLSLSPVFSGVFGPSGSNITPRSIGGLGGLALWQLLPRLVAFTFALTLAYRLRPPAKPDANRCASPGRSDFARKRDRVRHRHCAVRGVLCPGRRTPLVAVAIPTALAVPAFIYLMARPNSEEATG